MIENYLFNQMLNGLDNKLQAQLALYFNHQMMIEQFRHSKEMEQMKQEIIDEVLSRISVSADITNVIQEIDRIDRAIKNLGH